MATIQPGEFIGLLGKSSDLCWGELHTLVPDAVRVNNQFVSLPASVSPIPLNQRLGGLVKICEVIAENSQDEHTAAMSIADNFLKLTSEQLAISSFASNFDSFQVAKEVKSKSKEADRSIRFRILTDVYQSAGITTDWEEYILLDVDGNLIIARTITVQNLKHWTEKDYGRPNFDARSGMLPPKIARMLINLALPYSEISEKLTFYDPFCGSGTLLVEALDMGWSVIGSDLSDRAVIDSRKNCDWFSKQGNLKGDFSVFEADATHVSLKQLSHMVDGIAFEGYLGPPNPTAGRFQNLIKGLGKLYKGVLKTLYPLLNDGGMIVCALPVYFDQSKQWNLDKLIDDACSLGYTRLGTYSYARPHAVVGRKIYVLKKVAR